MTRTYGWTQQKVVGAQGVTVVANHLRSKGYVIEDVSEDKSYQSQDIDLLVRGRRQKYWRTVEVKTDTYVSGNLYLELVASSGKPGCVFQSRAQYWFYWLSGLGVLLCIDLPALQLWVMEHGNDYERRTVLTRQGRNTWGNQGITVPWQELCIAKVAYKQTLKAEEETCRGSLSSVA